MGVSSFLDNRPGTVIAFKSVPSLRLMGSFVGRGLYKVYGK